MDIIIPGCIDSNKENHGGFSLSTLNSFGWLSASRSSFAGEKNEKKMLVLLYEGHTFKLPTNSTLIIFRALNCVAHFASPSSIFLFILVLISVIDVFLHICMFYIYDLDFNPINWAQKQGFFSTIKQFTIFFICLFVLCCVFFSLSLQLICAIGNRRKKNPIIASIGLLTIVTWETWQNTFHLQCIHTILTLFAIKSAVCRLLLVANHDVNVAGHNSNSNGK